MLRVDLLTGSPIVAEGTLGVAGQGPKMAPTTKQAKPAPKPEVAKTPLKRAVPSDNSEDVTPAKCDEPANGGAAPVTKGDAASAHGGVAPAGKGAPAAEVATPAKKPKVDVPPPLPSTVPVVPLADHKGGSRCEMRHIVPWVRLPAHKPWHWRFNIMSMGHLSIVNHVLCMTP